MYYSTYERLGVHIYASNREVIKATARKFKRSVRRTRKYRLTRHAMYREMIKHHADARNLAKAFAL